jgi:hypothetical protein
LTDTTEVAAEIKRYCAEHPCVCDTLEGIAWWLAMQRYGDTMDDLRAAVDLLVEQKLLEPYRLADGRILFACSGAQPPPGAESPGLRT